MSTEDSNTVFEALDTLALALAGHEHQWTPEQRDLYERAVAILTEEHKE